MLRQRVKKSSLCNEVSVFYMIWNSERDGYRDGQPEEDINKNTISQLALF